MVFDLRVSEFFAFLDRDLSVEWDIVHPICDGSPEVLMYRGKVFAARRVDLPARFWTSHTVGIPFVYSQ